MLEAKFYCVFVAFIGSSIVSAGFLPGAMSLGLSEDCLSTTIERVRGIYYGYRWVVAYVAYC